MQTKDKPMTDAPTSVEKNTDPAIESGLERLTPDRIRQVIQQVLKKETGPRFKAYVETCMRCGLCAEACSYFCPMTGIRSSCRQPR